MRMIRKRVARTIKICHQKSAIVALKPPVVSGKMKDTITVIIGIRTERNTAMMVVVPVGRGPNQSQADHTTRNVMDVRSKSG